MSLAEQAQAQAAAIQALLAARAGKAPPAPVTPLPVPIIARPASADYPALAGRLFTRKTGVEKHAPQPLEQGNSDLLLFRGDMVELFTDRPLETAVDEFLTDQTSRLLWWTAGHPDGSPEFVRTVFRLAMLRDLPVFPALPERLGQKMKHGDVLLEVLDEVQKETLAMPSNSPDRWKRQSAVRGWDRRFKAWIDAGRGLQKK